MLPTRKISKHSTKVMTMQRFDGWENTLCHHGIKGQKHGIRRFQNPDGTLTAEGIARYRHSFGEVVRGARNTQKFEKRRQKAIAGADYDGNPAWVARVNKHANTTTEALGYTPVRGGKGNRFQKDLARTQLAMERKAAKYSEMAQDKSSMRYQQSVARAQFYVKQANMARAMQKRYNELGPQEQKYINQGAHLMRLGYFFGGVAGGLIGAGINAYRTNTLRKNTMQDMQRNPKKYQNMIS